MPATPVAYVICECANRMEQPFQGSSPSCIQSAHSQPCVDESSHLCSTVKPFRTFRRYYTPKPSIALPVLSSGNPCHHKATFNHKVQTPIVHLTKPLQVPPRDFASSCCRQSNRELLSGTPLLSLQRKESVSCFAMHGQCCRNHLEKSHGYPE